jgi:Ankyrin repeats (3 copies)
MNAWETEFIASLESKNESRAIEILRSGFPANYQIRIRDSNRNILPGHTYPLLYAVELELYELTHFLLVSGASVNCFDCLGQTAILISSFVGNLDIIRLLLKFKANIAARDFSGSTMLHLATMNSHLPVVKLCIEDLKFPIIVQNNKGQVPLDIARKNQENSKSLEETERIQQVIEYIWRTQEDFKRSRSKKLEHHNTYLLKYPRFSLQGLAKVPLVPIENNSVSQKSKRSLENYLNSKQSLIYKSYTAKETNITRISRLVSNTRNASPFNK